MGHFLGPNMGPLSETVLARLGRKFRTAWPHMFGQCLAHIGAPLASNAFFLSNGPALGRRGGIRKVTHAAREILGSALGSLVSKIVPKRVLSGRWGSIDGVEQIMQKWHGYFGAVVRRAYDCKSVRQSAQEDMPISEDKGEFWRVWSAKAKVNVVKSMNCTIFLIHLNVSYIVKNPLIHFLNWGQKVNRAHEANITKLAADPCNFVIVTTPAFDLVTHKCSVIAAEIENLTDAANTIWTPVLHLAADNPRMQKGARTLAVGAMYLAAADWDMRFTRPCNTYPFCFLNMLKAPPDSVCEVRRDVAMRLMEATESSLHKTDSVAPFRVSVLFLRIKTC